MRQLRICFTDCQKKSEVAYKHRTCGSLAIGKDRCSCFLYARFTVIGAWIVRYLLGAIVIFRQANHRSLNFGVAVREYQARCFYLQASTTCDIGWVSEFLLYLL
jgi:hypothetical protein